MKSEDGKIISSGPDLLKALSAKSLPQTSSISASSSSTVINKKRKDPVLSRTDSDDDDDEDAEDSMAYSKYVQSRLSQEAEPTVTLPFMANQSITLPVSLGEVDNGTDKVYSIIMQVRGVLAVYLILFKYLVIQSIIIIIVIVIVINITHYYSYYYNNNYYYS